VHAFDLNPKAREVCAELAKKNGVAGQVTIGELFQPQDFDTYAAQKTLVICDIEGAERDLLDPAQAPALLAMDLIVESHDCLVPGMTALLLKRFSATHDITVIEDDGQRQLCDPPLWFRHLANLDQLLAVWEWRSGPTPWLVMRVKSPRDNVAIEHNKIARHQVEETTSAIYFSPDGYQTSGQKLMGRHAAGAGFLRAFAATENAPHVTGLVSRPAFSRVFTAEMRAAGYSGQIRTVSIDAHAELSDPGTLYLPGPGLADFAWRRLAVGEGTYSLCGVTHTTASHVAMESITQLTTAPLREWDALICTSQAVLNSVQVLLEAQADYLRWRLGATRFSLPQLPVIPLGVHCADYEFSEAQRVAARAELGAAENDIVVIFLGRLSFHAKAHPQAMYLALKQVAAKFTDRTIHLVQCGWFANESIEKAFREGADMLCSTVRHHFLDGREATARTLAWASADIYVSLSDNIQETFGLSPLEAMAAGLPVVVSDWDGYRDTVRDGIDGFRIPTLMPLAPAGEDLAMRYEAGLDSYDIYCGHTCELVAVDVDATAISFERLIADPWLRKQMGDAGRQRARAVFDWRNVMGQYRELWADLAARRLAGASLVKKNRPAVRPDRMDPFLMFSGYPSRALLDGDQLVLVKPIAADAFAELMQRRNLAMNSFAHFVYPSEGECYLIVEQLASQPGISVADLESGFPVERHLAIRRGVVWMMKMHVLKFPSVN
jgi:starch synthase